MTTPEHSGGSPARKGAVLLALRYYGRQMAGLWRFTVPAMLLPCPRWGTPASTMSRR
jgi:ATP-binding cassette, subfamily B, bacterial